MPSMRALPIYQRIEARLRSDIATGRFREGDRMPSESELSSQFHTTRGTVRQALQRLEYEGLIIRTIGRGTFAAGPKFESKIDTRFALAFEVQMKAKGSKISLDVVAFGPQPAPESIATALGLLAGDGVYRLERRRLVDDEVVGCEDRWLLAEIGRRVKPAALKTQSAIAIVEAALDGPLGDLEVVVSATAASGERVRRLEVRRGSPLLVRAHTFFDRRRRPVLTGQSIYRADRYQFSYVLESTAVGARSAAVP
jgi:GntR family transcriptional regulator